MRPDAEDECNCQHTRGWHSDDGCEKCDCAGFDDETPEPYVPDDQEWDEGYCGVER